ncbi:hypothetical protein VNO78_27780 [Psophocarpus tetragonolobus]|uniref:Uncharacterized protein n=1 Tax=Psophocarpus tetragonolobus TaxID=3891 RepID=A0AAN9XAY4_PSOTE
MWGEERRELHDDDEEYLGEEELDEVLKVLGFFPGKFLHFMAPKESCCSATEQPSSQTPLALAPQPSLPPSTHTSPIATLLPSSPNLLASSATHPAPRSFPTLVLGAGREHDDTRDLEKLPIGRECARKKGKEDPKAEKVGMITIDKVLLKSSYMESAMRIIVVTGKHGDCG